MALLYRSSSVRLQNCVFSGIVEGTYISTTSTSQVGGLVGDSVGKLYIESCWTEGEVIGGNALGGLVGQVYMQTGAEIKNSYSTMTLSPQGGCDSCVFTVWILSVPSKLTGRPQTRAVTLLSFT